MSGMNWTKAQSRAIEHPGGENMLVAAAAGSGKTAVLVERIIRRILDKNDPVSVDELLVLTFTDSTAEEMRNKIASAIERRLAEDPDNRRLREQSMKLGAADISTIHSFAKKIITNNIHKTDIPADFSIADGNANATIINEALDDCLERFYERIDRDPSFAALTFGHGGIKNDKSLRKMIISLYAFARSLARPEKWLNDSVDMYRRAARSGLSDDSPWGKALAEAVRREIDSGFKNYRAIVRILCRSFPGNEKAMRFYVDEAARYSDLKNFDSLSEFYEKKNAMKFNTMPGATKEEKASPELMAEREKIKDHRDMAKDVVNEHKLFLYKDVEQITDGIIKQYPVIRTLKNILLMLMRRHRRMKLSLGLLDFNDLEHYLLNMLTNSRGEPTELCETLRGRYREIYVDEYQDTNNIQDTLFRVLSGGRGNLFMVGDLKQSIYGFRNASSALFLDKYNRYGAGSGGTLTILSDNFRSRGTVVRTVNEIFENIMTANTAGIDYDENERLKAGADFPAAEDESAYETELIICSPVPGKTRHEIEAEAVARRIIDLVYNRKTPIYDSKTGETRPIEFGDIAVLFRSISSPLDVYEAVFAEYGIPTLSKSGGFLESVEIGTVLAFLAIIDNPLQDIDLIAVMRSPIFGFTADELAAIRASRRKCSFYEAVEAAAESDDKAAGFIGALNKMREYSEYMGIHELVYKICYDFDYIAVASAMRGGEGRRANLRLLLKTASDFERKGLSGLFDFIEYLKNVSGNGGLRMAVTADGGSAVQLMTIHKSKGLEYPVVILANASYENTNSNPLVFSEKLGIALSYVDTERRVKYPTLPRDLVGYYNNIDERAEEMRLLYVAMTRAREKLIISFSETGKSKKWKKPFSDENGKIFSVCVEDTSILRDWIVFGLLNNENLDGLREMMENDISDFIVRGGAPVSVTFFRGTEDAPAAEPETAESGGVGADIDPEKLGAALEYEYPRAELTKIPLKLSVSEIKNYLRENIGEQEWEYTPRLRSIADRTFHRAERDDAAERGTITHFVLQHIDPLRTETPGETAAQISELAIKGVISEAQLERVDQDSIITLFNSETGAEIRAAAERGGLERELKMLFPMKASEVYGDPGPGDAEIIVQGVADCVCLSEDGAALIDYKTDSCTAEQAAALAEKYRVQIECYTRGIEAILGVSVKKRIIYFLTPGTAVEI